MRSKFAASNMTGARAGDEQAVRGDELKREFVEVGVFALAFLVLAAVDELRRIGDDEVPGAAVFDHGARPGEGVGVGELDLRAVDVGVAPGHGDGGFIEIDAHRRPMAPARAAEIAKPPV